MIDKIMEDDKKIQRQEDYESIRKDIKDVLIKSKEVIMDFGDMALAAQNHNAYKAYGEFLANFMNNVDKLIELDEKMANLEAIETPKEEININNNQQNIFFGSTRDVLAMLKKTKKEMEKFEKDELKTIEGEEIPQIEEKIIVNEVTESKTTVSQEIKAKED